MNKTESIYGELPIDLGRINVDTDEMMFWMYCPIKLPGSMSVSVPDNLKKFSKMWKAVMLDSLNRWKDSYVYITSKTLFATPENPGNRPGWHSDGFLTDDLNYVWCDANPTVFFSDGNKHSFDADHGSSLKQMDDLCEKDEVHHVTYPVKHLLRLDETVLHKVSTNIESGVRTFVKISLSRNRYALRGNSINHELAPDWTYFDRNTERKCPIGGKS